jgi:hypothetical protein
MKQKAKPPPEPPTGATPPPPPNPEAAAHIHKPLKPAANKKTDKFKLILNEMVKSDLGVTGELAAVLFNEALEMARENKDVAAMLKMSLEVKKEAENEFIRQQTIETERSKKKQEQEKAEKLTIENEIRKGNYVDKKEVKLFYGKIISVHSNILASMSVKLAATLAAIPDGAEKEIKMKKFIDNEIYSALGMIKKTLSKYVKDGE